MKCYATLREGVLALGNDRIERRFEWNGGNLISRALVDRRARHEWPLRGTAPDCEFPGETAEASGGRLKVRERPLTPIAPAHLEAEVTVRLGALEVRRVFRLYPGCPAIACDFYLRGRSAAEWLFPRGTDTEAVLLYRLFEARRDRSPGPVLDRLVTGMRHLQVEATQYFDVTDLRDNLLTTRRVLPYTHPVLLAGNVLFAWDTFAGHGLFMVKEAPASDVQLAWPGCDFVCSLSDLAATGVGVSPADLLEKEWTRGYGIVTGVTGAGEFERLAALRAYQTNRRRMIGRRDHMVLLNTWGDRGAQEAISEPFALAELNAAKRLGCTHFQLDAGWQTGQAEDARTPDLKGIWNRKGYWTVNRRRLPNGLAPIAAHSRRTGVELCLWFNPSDEDSYAHWRDDARVLIELHRRHGIRTFKIDGVMIPDKRAERNFRAFLDAVLAATGGQAVFNLDVTAGRRFAYHSFYEYGNFFLENRYTDWGNHWPHRTLRNLWQLSRTVPPETLQVEFLNPWRNAARYAPDDPLAPQRVPFDYCFAITMMAQPLAWFEASKLPEEAFRIAPMVKTYLKHQERIHGGCILPIGEEPCGAGWTGFQSCGNGQGYFAVYRELNERRTARLNVWGLDGRRVACRPVLGHGRPFAATVAADGTLPFALPGPFTYSLYAYRATPRK